VLIWGGVYPGAKLGLSEIPFLSFTSLRLVVAALVLLAVSHQLLRPSIPRSLWPALLGAGLAQIVFQTFFVLSMQWTTAGNGAVLLAVAPLLAALWQVAVQGFDVHARTWLGLVIGLVGALMVVTATGEIALGSQHLLGSICAFVSAAGWAWYGIAAGRVVGALGSRAATGWTMAMAAVVLLPASFGELMIHPGGMCHGWDGSHSSTDR
jgi:drug/metabolite transporter (DMT)-like permease